PGSVPDAWRHFFESLKEERGTVGADHREPAWATPLSKLQANGELVVALTGDYGEVERNLQSKISAHANQLGIDLLPIASFRATQDSIRALMLIRAYRVMGHLAADLDPLDLTERRVHAELKPETYGFTEA